MDKLFFFCIIYFVFNIFGRHNKIYEKKRTLKKDYILLFMFVYVLRKIGYNTFQFIPILLLKMKFYTAHCVILYLGKYFNVYYI